MSGTVRALEIVIFLSDVGEELYEAPKYCRMFTEQKLVRPGPARQMALSLCRGDLVLYQDADDYPHKRRVEIIRQMFDSEDIVLLTNQWSASLREIKTGTIDFRHIKRIGGQEIYNHYFPNGNLTDCSKIYTAYGGDMMRMNSAGDPCIRREILKEVKWKNNCDLTLLDNNGLNGEDYEFCMEVAFKYKKSMMISPVLSWYRIY
jgi:hypothetical protein